MAHVGPVEYLKRDDATGQKLEYHYGEVKAMAVGTLNHACIAANVVRTLGNKLLVKGRGCEPFGSDLRLQLNAGYYYFYPDVMVACPPFEFTSEKKTAIANASLVVEVLSPSTASDDCMVKLPVYQQQPGILQIIYIDSESLKVRSYRRTGNTWEQDDLKSTPKAIIEIPHLESSLALAEVYGTIIEQGF